MIYCPYCSQLSTILFSVVTPIQAQQNAFILLTTVNNYVGSTTLFNPLIQQAQSYVANKVCIVCS